MKRTKFKTNVGFGTNRVTLKEVQNEANDSKTYIFWAKKGGEVYSDHVYTDKADGKLHLDEALGLVLYED